MKPLIRRAYLKDAVQVRSVLHQAHKQNTRLGCRFPAARISLSHLQNNMRKDVYFVLVDGQRILGVMAVRNRRKQWQIGALCLLPSCRKRGYGRKLLRFAEQRIRALGGRRAVLLTPQKHPYLPGYYRKRGYRGLRRVHFHHISWLVMAKNLIRK